jgi:hypothetical protein
MTFFARKTFYRAIERHRLREPRRDYAPTLSFSVKTEAEKPYNYRHPPTDPNILFKPIISLISL